MGYDVGPNPQGFIIFKFGSFTTFSNISEKSEDLIVRRDQEQWRSEHFLSEGASTEDFALLLVHALKQIYLSA